MAESTDVTAPAAKRMRVGTSAEPKCRVHTLSDDVLTQGFSFLPTLADKFTLELVCRRWNRLAHERVWPAYKRFADVNFGPLSRDPDVEEPLVSNDKFLQLVDRLSHSLVELDLGACNSVFAIVVNVSANLGKIFTQLTHLRHLRLTNTVLDPTNESDLPEKVEQLRTLVLHECSVGVNAIGEDLLLPCEWKGFSDFFARFTRLEMLVFSCDEIPDEWEDTYSCKVAALPKTLKHLYVMIPTIAGLAEWQAVALEDCNQLESISLQAPDNAGVPSSIQRIMLVNMREFGDGANGPLGRPRPLTALRIGFSLRRDTVGCAQFDKTLVELGRTLKVLEMKHTSPEVLSSIAKHCHRLEHLDACTLSWRSGEVNGFKGLAAGEESPFRMPELKSLRISTSAALRPRLLRYLLGRPNATSQLIRLHIVGPNIAADQVRFDELEPVLDANPQLSTLVCDMKLADLDRLSSHMSSTTRHRHENTNQARSTLTLYPPSSERSEQITAQYGSTTMKSGLLRVEDGDPPRNEALHKLVYGSMDSPPSYAREYEIGS